MARYSVFPLSGFFKLESSIFFGDSCCGSMARFSVVSVSGFSLVSFPGDAVFWVMIPRFLKFPDNGFSLKLQIALKELTSISGLVIEELNSLSGLVIVELNPFTGVDREDFGPPSRHDRDRSTLFFGVDRESNPLLGLFDPKFSPSCLDVE